MPHVVIATGEFPPGTGGIGTYAWEAASGLRGLGWTVSVVARQQYASNEHIAAFNQQQAFEVKRVELKQAVSACREVLAREPVDVLLGADTLGLSWLYRASAFRSFPLVTVVHGSELCGTPWFRRQLKRLLYARCATLISNSQFTRKLMTDQGVRARHWEIIPPGGRIANNDACQTHSDDLRQRWRLENKRVILTMGTLSARKGQSMVLRALPTVLRSVPDVHYVACGRDAINGCMARLAGELGMADHVTFTGPISESEKAAYFELSDFHILLSQHVGTGQIEGYGIAIIEAALCNRTSIGTFGTGLEEAIVNNQTGILVPQDDVEAIAGEVVSLLQDNEKRLRLQQAACSRAERDCTWNKRISHLDGVLRRFV